MRSKTSLFAGLTPPTKKPVPLIPQQIANNRDIRSVSARLKKSFRLGTILVPKRRISQFYMVQKVRKAPGFTRKPGVFLELVT